MAENKMLLLLYLCFFLLVSGEQPVVAPNSANIYEVNCSSLLMGQYICLNPEIDPLTQQPKGCNPNNTAQSNQIYIF